MTRLFSLSKMLTKVEKFDFSNSIPSNRVISVKDFVILLESEIESPQRRLDDGIRGNIIAYMRRECEQFTKSQKVDNRNRNEINTAERRR
jgi:hypothetical protein